MRASVVLFLFGVLTVASLALPKSGLAQTEALPAISRETYRQRQETPVPAVPLRVVPERVLPERVVVERVTPEPVVVAERAAVREVVTPRPVVAWFDAFVRNRYGYYDDGYLDDNWFYDYYEYAVPKAAVVTPPVTATTPGYRTSWIYEPAAERALFSW